MNRPFVYPCHGPIQTTQLANSFLVCRKKRKIGARQRAEGRSYLQPWIFGVNLARRHDDRSSQWWEAASSGDAAFCRADDFVKVQARVESYRSKLQICQSWTSMSPRGRKERWRRGRFPFADTVVFFAPENVAELYVKRSCLSFVCLRKSLDCEAAFWMES